MQWQSDSLYLDGKRITIGESFVGYEFEDQSHAQFLAVGTRHHQESQYRGTPTLQTHHGEVVRSASVGIVGQRWSAVRCRVLYKTGWQPVGKTARVTDRLA